MKLDRTGRNTLFIILEGIAATVVLYLYNPFLQMFAKRLGGGDVHFALVNSLPPLVAIFVLIPCSIALEKFSDKKKAAVFLLLINGIFFGAISLVPFIPGSIKIIVYLILIGLMNWPASLYTTCWQSFFSDNFKGSAAGRVYSVRSSLGTFFGLITALVTGYILSAFPGNDLERIRIYQIFYVICFAFIMLQAVSLSRVTAVNGGSGSNPGTSYRLADVKNLLKNRKYIIYCLIAFAFHVSWQMGWPVFFIYNVDVAKLGEFQLGLINVAAGAASFVSYPLWNRFIEKKGIGFTLFVAGLGIAANPVFYTVKMNVYGVIGANLFGGIFTAGFSLALFLGLLKTLPEGGKTVCISVFNTFINISGFASPLVGVWLYRMTGVYAAFGLISGIRAAAALLYLVKWAVDRAKLRNTEGINTTA